jgi:DNA-binding SARP family transcriptional activator/tetratricopeptide (TPR) repeat protein
MRFRILGPIEVQTSQGWSGIGASKWRSLLAVLLLHPERVVATDQLLAELWQEKLPAGARKLVNLYVLRLRRLIGDPLGEVLVTRAPGYLLHVETGDLDSWCFERQVAESRDEWKDGHAERAAGRLASALALWRGPALSDVTAPSALLETRRLEEARVSALQLRVEADLACGRHAEVVGELRELVARHSLHEQFWSQLIRALRESGRDAEALQTYEHARVVIADELGSDPGPELRALHQAMIARQNQHPDGAIPSGETRWATALPVSQLPADVADFTGRQSQIADLVKLLNPARGRVYVPVAVICGLPGAGKTSLALHVAHRLCRRFPDGQLYVHLDGSSSEPREPGEVLGELLRALGVPHSAIPGSTRHRSAALRSALAGRRVLLVADDAASAEQIEPLLPGTPGSAVIATSRTLLVAARGAHLFHIQPLAHGEALEMLSRIVGQGRVKAESEAAEKLVTACGNLPLAIRIAGARLAARPSWPVSQYAEMISDERRRLAELQTGGLGVRASFALSYHGVPQSAQRAFRLLALVGPGDFAAWTVTALLGDGQEQSSADLLADRCMLTALGVDLTGQPRYRLHDLLRSYAAERLADDAHQGRRAALDRVITAWAEIADLARSRLPPDPYYPPAEGFSSRRVVPDSLARRLAANPLAWFNSERANLIYMTEQACSAQMLAQASHLLKFQTAFHFFQGRFDDHERLIRALESAAVRAGDLRTVSDAQLRLAGIVAHRGRHSEAMTMFEQCLSALESRGDLEAFARGLYWQAYCATKQGLDLAARRIAERSVCLARRLADRPTELMALRVLGQALAHLGDTAGGVRLCEQALAIARRLGVPYYEQLTLRTLAHLVALSGNWELAMDLCRQGLDLTGRADPISGQAYFLSLLGGAQNGLHRHDDAIDSLSHAAAIFYEWANGEHTHDACSHSPRHIALTATTSERLPC